jgi:hypothetical protein
MRTHTVSANERLSDIAATYQVPVEAMLEANRHKPRMRLGSGVEVFASLSAGEDIVVPDHVGRVDGLGWPWSDCPPAGGTPNNFGRGCTPPMYPSEKFKGLYDIGASIGPSIISEVTLYPELPPGAPYKNGWVCSTACWTGDTCDCSEPPAIGGPALCRNGECGALSAQPAGLPEAPKSSITIVTNADMNQALSNENDRMNALDDKYNSAFKEKRIGAEIFAGWGAFYKEWNAFFKDNYTSTTLWTVQVVEQTEAFGARRRQHENTLNEALHQSEPPPEMVTVDVESPWTTTAVVVTTLVVAAAGAGAWWLWNRQPPPRQYTYQHAKESPA